MSINKQNIDASGNVKKKKNFDPANITRKTKVPAISEVRLEEIFCVNLASTWHNILEIERAFAYSVILFK